MEAADEEAHCSTVCKDWSKQTEQLSVPLGPEQFERYCLAKDKTVLK